MILKGEKVILRPIILADAPRFVKWLSDKDIFKYLQAQDRHLTLEKERKWIRDNLKDKTKKNFAIETFSGKHIGSVSLDVTKHKSAIFGIFICKEYWNMGLGTDAGRTIIDYGFSRLKLHRILLSVMSYNPRALKVYKRLGFKLEGRRREHVLFDGKYYDLLEMGILDREWNKLKK
jgi:RimJ/RimL family protein N-acetyltransferase